MHAKNVQREQSQQGEESQRQQQQQKQQEEQLSVDLLLELDEAISSLRSLHDKLDLGPCKESIPFEETISSVIELLAGVCDRVRKFQQGPDSGAAVAFGYKSGNGQPIHRRAGLLQRLDAALFEPPHTFAAVLALVMTQLELAAAEDSC
ncbi:MAG TPA: hypothetical protein VMY42_11120 [Thermoguttaceae bacterium]|nr:hypothetical protein [Thermoguttaceae bacterium]